METIIKALRLLKQLAEKPMSVTEAAQFLDVHKSSASRLLASMQDEGFVKLNTNRKYEIGHVVFMLCNTSSEIQDIKNIARPSIQSLNATTDEVVHLSILNGNNMTYIDKVDTSKMIRMHSKIGFSYPAYCTAVGKVLIAYQKDSEIEKLIHAYDLEQFTENTITDLNKLKENLNEIRNNGIAYDFGENFDNINCIAAPVFNFKGNIVASVSIAAPVFYTDIEKLVGYKDLLIKTVLSISKKLGYKGTIPPKQ